MVLVFKPQTIREKTKMYYTNYHNTNHNVKTRRVQRKEKFIPIVYEVIIQQIRV
jgi:hypothetical protein